MKDTISRTINPEYWYGFFCLIIGIVMGVVLDKIAHDSKIENNTQPLPIIIFIDKEGKASFKNKEQETNVLDHKKD